MQSTAELIDGTQSAKLKSMNWVEKRANKERAIRLNGNDVYLDLVRSMESAIQSFNERYRGHKDWPPVEILKRPDRWFSVAKSIKIHNGAIWEDQKRSFVCELKDEPTRIELIGNAAPPIGFIIDADESGRVFLREQAGDHAEKTFEEVSQAILEQFLFEQG
jgi:hypothetical protein